MVQIHPTALIDPTASLGTDVSIGPFCIVEANVKVGDRSKLGSRSILKQGATIGSDNELSEGVILGGKAQHLKADARPGNLVVGNGNIIRENVTMHVAMHEFEATTVGDNNLFMVNVHVGHDCQVGSSAIFANNTMLGGHVQVQDRAVLSGGVGVHQFCRIGTLAMCGGYARVVQDVPPYMMVDGFAGGIVGLNLVGLKRNGFISEQISELKEAYRVIYRSGLKWSEVLDVLKSDFNVGPASVYHTFLSSSKRGFVHERRTPRDATIPMPKLDGDSEEQRIRVVG